MKSIKAGDKLRVVGNDFVDNPLGIHCFNLNQIVYAVEDARDFWVKCEGETYLGKEVEDMRLPWVKPV